MKKLTFVPEGGIANRLRSVASAVALAVKTNAELEIVWFRDGMLNAPFSSLFKPLEIDGVTVREARAIDRITCDRPRWSNLWIPALPLRLRFNKRISSTDVCRLRDAGFDFISWGLIGSNWLSCHNEFGEWDDLLMRLLFRPTAEVAKRVSAITERFTSHTIGIHIRGTGNTEPVRNNPTAAFEDIICREIGKYGSEASVFLATDDATTRKKLKKRYGNIIITADGHPSQDPIEYIRGGVADLWALSRTRRIYGSCGSTFSGIAARLGDIDCTMVKNAPQIRPLFTNPSERLAVCLPYGISG